MNSFTLRQRRQAYARAVLATLVLVVVAASAVVVTRSLDDSSSGEVTEPSGSPPATAVPTPAVRTAPVVLTISVDGLNPAALTALSDSHLPNFARLINEGASTLNARDAFELTTTLPNHTGMLTGRGVAGRNGHNVTFNKDNEGTLAEVHGEYVPGLFDVAHDHGLRTAFFAEKDKFNLLLRSWDGKQGALDETGDDNGRDKTDIQLIDDSDDVVIRGVLSSLHDGKTDLIFLHLAAPDRAGHDAGWLGPEYVEAVEQVDRDLGKILTSIDTEPDLKRHVTVLLTADHGGPRGAKAHSESTDPQNYTIPFVAWGNGVAAGVDLYSLNPDRRDPGTSHPDYTGTQPVRNMDLADTALQILGLPPIDGTVSSGWPRLRLK